MRDAGRPEPNLSKIFGFATTSANCFDDPAKHNANAQGTENHSGGLAVSMLAKLRTDTTEDSTRTTRTQYIAVVSHTHVPQ